jgi:hypothetical protein
MFNDLIGLEYRWGCRPGDNSGFTDCFGLTMEIRSRLGLYDFYPDFEWVYEKHKEETIAARQILKWLWARGERIQDARAGAVFRNASQKGHVALAAVIDPSSAMFLGSDQRVICAPLATVARGKFFWAD